MTNRDQLKLKAQDGKYSMTDVVDIEGMFRLIEPIRPNNWHYRSSHLSINLYLFSHNNNPTKCLTLINIYKFSLDKLSRLFI